MEIVMILLLAFLLTAGTLCNINVIYGLLLWLFLLVIYGLRHGFSLKTVGKSSLSQVSSVFVVLINFLFIGMLSAVLRECGCIAYVVSLCTQMKSGIFLLPASFLVCTLMSLCTGSSFATVASVGVICATIGQMAGIPYALVCGAVLSGIYVGDRISAVSSSALLVSGLSEIDNQKNISLMWKRFPLPFFLTLGIYIVLGICFRGNRAAELTFTADYSVICLLPLALILILSFFRISSRQILTIAIICGLCIAVLINQDPIFTALYSLVFGYQSADASLAILNGGGIISMVKVSVIILIASCYIGIFQVTGFLDSLKIHLQEMKLSSDGKGILLGILCSFVGGSQTLAVILASMFFTKEMSPEEKSIQLEDNPILFSAMVPWNTACNVPLTTLGASAACIPFAFYLYLVPLCHYLKGKCTK